MLSRREVLSCLAASPLLAAGSPQGVIFLEQPGILARESAAGYRSLLRGRGNRIIIAPACRRLNCAALLPKVRCGYRLIVESGSCFSPASEALEIFGFRIGAPVKTSGHIYVEYSRPQRHLVRTFEAVSPILCEESEVIARWRGLPVSATKNIGAGSVTYLGSMLGPGLLADEREAHAVGEALIFS